MLSDSKRDLSTQRQMGGSGALGRLVVGARSLSPGGRLGAEMSRTVGGASVERPVCELPGGGPGPVGGRRLGVFVSWGRRRGTGAPRTGRKQATKASVPSLPGHFESWSPKTAPNGSILGVIPCVNGRQRFILNFR